MSDFPWGAGFIFSEPIRPSAAVPTVPALEVPSMLPRTLTIALSLCLAGQTIAQTAPPAAKPANPAAPTDVDRRLADLDKYLAGALTEVQALRRDVKALAAKSAPQADGDFKLVQLKHANAVQVAKVLQEFLGRGGGLVVTADAATNTLLARGLLDELVRMMKIVEQLDAAPAERRGAAADELDRQHKGVDRARQELAEYLEQWTKMAQADLDMQKDRVAWMERMAKRNYVSESQVGQERARLQLLETTLAHSRKALEGLAPPPVRK